MNVDVHKLATLARIRVPEDHLAKFSQEFEAILGYVGQLEKLALPAGARERPAQRNVFREDGEPHETGRYTDKLAEQFRGRSDDNALVVKQVISHD